jgi:flagellar protein FliO/FliZ
MRHNFINRQIPFLFLFLFVSSLSSQSETERMDDLLNKELGNKTKQTDKKEKDAPKEPPATVKDAPNPVEERYKKEDDSVSSLLWLLLKLVLVFGFLTGGMYYVLKLISKNTVKRYPVKEAVKILSSTPIAPGKQVQIIDVFGSLFLIGVSEQSISLITEIKSVETKERILMSKDEAEPAPENFLEILASQIKNTFSKNGSPTESTDKPMTSQENYDPDILEEIKARQLERLEKMKQERTNLSQKNDNKG